MSTTEQQHGDLSLSDRKAILMLDSDFLPPDPENGTEGIDLSVLSNYEFDAIADRIVGYRDLSQIESDWRNRPSHTSSSNEAERNKQLSPDGYSSSYRHIKAILKASGMQDGDTFVDIGCSYGRVGCVVGVNFPNARFLGYDIIRERVAEAQRVAQFLQLHNVRYHHADASADDLELPQANWFFLFNPLDKKALAVILKKIYHSQGNHETRLIAKYTGDLEKYANSPYLQLISKIGGEPGSLDACWFYRFKQPL